MTRASRNLAERVYLHCVEAIEASPNVPIALESEWALVRRFSVSRPTVRQALQRLVREGRAVCHAGKGYFSRPKPVVGDVKRLKVGVVSEPPPRLYAAMRTAGLTTVCKSLESHRFTWRVLPIEVPETGMLTQRALAAYDVDAYLLYSVSPATQAFFAGQSKPTVMLGNTIRELGLASVALDELDIVRQITEQLLAQGHRLVTLVQEKSTNLGNERSRVGFLYAHHAQRARFLPDRILRIDRAKTGVSKTLATLFQLAPTAMLVQSVPLLELIWSRATSSQQTWLETTEVVVLLPDFSGVLRHPAKIVEFDMRWESEAAIKLLEDCLRGRTKMPRHMSIPWKLVECRDEPPTANPG